MDTSWGKILFTIVAVSVTGTICHAGIIKNSNVGGYKVIVEGGGLEKRKEIQYDASGKQIYNSEKETFNQLLNGKSKLMDDESLFGEEDGLELENFGSPKKASTPQKEENPPQKEEKPSSKNNTTQKTQPRPPAENKTKSIRSPWAAPKKLPQDVLDKIKAKKQKEREQASSDKKRRDSSVLLNPRESMLDQPTTEDGRKLPFYIAGGNSKGQIDPNATLKNYMKLNDNFSNIQNPEIVETFEKTERYTNIIGLEQWHKKYSSIGRKTTERYNEPSSLTGRQFQGESKILEKELLENNKTWDRSRKSQITVNNSLAQKIIERFATSNSNRYGSMRLASPGEKTGLSMQDINRYQFRRSHSTEAGLSTVSPGGNGVEKK